jgi:hypothetical protein
MGGHLDCCGEAEIEHVRNVSEGFHESEWICRCRRCGQFWYSSSWTEQVAGGRLEEVRYFRISPAEAAKILRGSARPMLEDRDAIAVLNGASARRVRGFGPV